MVATPSKLDSKLLPFDRPDRSLILTGISRSGTSLLCALINDLPNTVCLNEVLPTDLDRLPRALARTRRDLLRGRPVANKFDADGSLTTNTLATSVVRDKRAVNKPLDADLVLGSKRNIPYLLALDRILALELPVVVLVRDPVYAIGSWGGQDALHAQIPGARIGPENEHPHWAPLHLSRQDPIERRAEAWQACAERVWTVHDHVTLLRYEDLCADPERALDAVARRFGIPLPASLPQRPRPAQNLDDRYPNLDRVRAAVSALCPLREALGYA